MMAARAEWCGQRRLMGGMRRGGCEALKGKCSGHDKTGPSEAPMESRRNGWNRRSSGSSGSSSSSGKIPAPMKKQRHGQERV